MQAATRPTPNFNKTAGGYNNNKILKFYQPYNIIVFLSFFSPILLTLSILSTSFMFQNTKGIVYIFILLIAVFIREIILFSRGGKASNPFDNNICNDIQFSAFGNSGFSMFVFAFTIMYLCGPMIINGDINYWVVSWLLGYMIIDFFIKSNKGCLGSMINVCLNILGGLTLGLLVLMIIYIPYSGGANLSNILFFNEISSTKEICSMPKKQTFKCAVYKNGELVKGATPSA